MDGETSFGHRMELEQCIKTDGGKNLSFFRVRTTVNKDWPDDMGGLARA